MSLANKAVLDRLWEQYLRIIKTDGVIALTAINPQMTQGTAYDKGIRKESA